MNKDESNEQEEVLLQFPEDTVMVRAAEIASFDEWLAFIEKQIDNIRP